MTEQEKRWIEAWRIAGPELKRIRDDELRSLDDIRQGKQLNRDLILEELEPLVELKEEPAILDDLNKLF